MSKEKPIARLQPSKWEPLTNAISNLLELVATNKLENFLVKFQDDREGPMPYVAAKRDLSGDLVLMFPGDLYLNPDLTPIQKTQLDGLGWSLPRSSNPQYTKRLSESLDPKSSAMYLVATLRLIFDIPINSTVIIEPDKAIEAAFVKAGMKPSEQEGMFHIP
jgi:hypothetical protein